MIRIKRIESLSIYTKPHVTQDIGSPSIWTQRIASIDAYRGFVMLLMMAEILAFPILAKTIPGNTLLQFLSFNQTHVPWAWVGVHDLIQPSFTFLVGVALPFSIKSRRNKGATLKGLLKHAIKRSIILISLGIFLRYIYSDQTSFTFEDTLTQIGLGYTFLVILGCYSQRVQIIALVLILVGYWLAFALYPLPDVRFDYASAGTTENWKYNFSGFAAHWNKNTNIASAFDRWFLNLFPQKNTFLNNSDGYVTLSFIPTLGTMILGLFAGNTLTSSLAPGKKIKTFLVVGCGIILLGIFLHITGINPIVKRIWTPAWTIFSGGICLLLLAFFYSVIDVAGKKRWSFFLIIVGANSIVAYFLSAGGREVLSKVLFIHFGHNYNFLYSTIYLPLVIRGLVLLFEWLILNWMYRRQIFIKI